MSRSIEESVLIKKDKDILENKKYSVLQSALSRVEIEDIMSNPNEVNKLPFVFNHQLKEKVSATDQYYSGRCWIFAGLNVLRYHLIDHYKLDESFELSEAFIFKYDRIEKCNYLLELLYHNAKTNSLNELEYIDISNTLNDDGGTIDQLKNIINKYGIVPKTIFPDNIQSRSTRLLNDLLQTLMRKATIVINKKMSRNEFNEYKKILLDECYRLLTMTIGSIPLEFTWTYKDSRIPSNFTPLTFYNKIVKSQINLDNYIPIINDERNPFNKLIAVEYLNNVVNENKDYKHTICNMYINVDIKTIKNAIFKTITKYGTPVWFASDYNYFLMNNETILDPHSSTIEDIFDINIVKNKKLSLSSRITQPVHAMIFVGCQKENNKYLRWKVENSHGDDNKFKGFLVMSDSFFDDYMMIAFVHKNTLSKELRDMYNAKKESDIKWVPFWDILGYSAE